MIVFAVQFCASPWTTAFLPDMNTIGSSRDSFEFKVMMYSSPMPKNSEPILEDVVEMEVRLGRVLSRCVKSRMLLVPHNPRQYSWPDQIPIDRLRFHVSVSRLILLF